MLEAFDQSFQISEIIVGASRCYRLKNTILVATSDLIHGKLLGKKRRPQIPERY